VNPYDQKAWEALERERERQLNRRPRRLLPSSVRNGAASIAGRVRDGAEGVPGYDKAAELVEQWLTAAGDVGGRLAADSLNSARIVDAYSRAGHDVGLISDVQNLTLRTVDEVKPRLGRNYMAAGIASGATAGAAVSGGQIMALVGAASGGAVGAVGGAGVGAVPGAGAGAAPGAGVVIGAMTADTVAALLASMRVIFHTAAYYGYDTRRPEERIRALGVLNFATAGDQSAKLGAYNELQQVANMIVRNATWSRLNENVMTKIVRRVFDRTTQRLTKQKLGTAVFALGVVLGPVANAKTISAAADGADLLYRQQFLCDKYGLPFPDSGQEPETEQASNDEIPISDIVEGTIDEDDPAGAQSRPPSDGE
jgi:hypothetical protein